ncbi:hypothetical protein SYNPS1DRAFT_26615 [Syncephalis pseudoplumigaleata]|uniref:Lung seven transmembrane receptor-domain-containing protein n=1 Tax=Syncephalis pseudoplumigaleata TaxID=1712513 RepID=A0A4P9Z6F7_9FUNG|nr:hypothetical protein SYNPS1DRAFT_26615 [Syncephalis pseudoplumigaleata]|eukprot:RKP27742.1 hypothetical protein SYNPS1DRAFT_26615 [Syncephalis pseudoplumigaleata]
MSVWWLLTCLLLQCLLAPVQQVLAAVKIKNRLTGEVISVRTRDPVHTILPDFTVLGVFARLHFAPNASCQFTEVAPYGQSSLNRNLSADVNATIAIAVMKESGPAGCTDHDDLYEAIERHSSWLVDQGFHPIQLALYIATVRPHDSTAASSSGHYNRRYHHLTYQADPTPSAMMELSDYQRLEAFMARMPPPVVGTVTHGAAITFPMNDVKLYAVIVSQVFCLFRVVGFYLVLFVWIRFQEAMEVHRLFTVLRTVIHACVALMMLAEITRIIGLFFPQVSILYQNVYDVSIYIVIAMRSCTVLILIYCGIVFYLLRRQCKSKSSRYALTRLCIMSFILAATTQLISMDNILALRYEWIYDVRIVLARKTLRNTGSVIQSVCLLGMLSMRLSDEHTRRLWRHACMLYYNAGEMEKQWFAMKIEPGLGSGTISGEMADHDGADDADDGAQYAGCSWYRLWCWCHRMEQRWRNGEARGRAIRHDLLSWSPAMEEARPAEGGRLYSLFTAVASSIEDRLRTRDSSDDRAEQTAAWATCFSGTLLERTHRHSEGGSRAMLEHALLVVQPSCWTGASTTGECGYRLVPLQTPRYFCIVSVSMDAFNIVAHVRTDAAQDDTAIFIWQYGRAEPIRWSAPACLHGTSTHGTRQEWRPLSLFNGWLMVAGTATAIASGVSAATLPADGQAVRYAYPVHACYLPTLAQTSADVLGRQCAVFGMPGIHLVMRADHSEMVFVHLEHSLDNTRQYTWSLHRFANSTNEQMSHSAAGSAFAKEAPTAHLGGGTFAIDTDKPCLSIASKGVQVVRVNDHQLLIEVKLLGVEERWLGLLDTRTVTSSMHGSRASASTAATAAATASTRQPLRWSKIGRWNRLPFLLPGDARCTGHERLLLTLDRGSPSAELVDAVTGAPLCSISRRWRLEVLAASYVRLGHLVPVTDSDETVKFLDTSTRDWRMLAPCDRAVHVFCDGAPLFYTITHRLTSASGKSTLWGSHEAADGAGRYYLLDASGV